MCSREGTNETCKESPKIMQSGQGPSLEGGFVQMNSIAYLLSRLGGLPANAKLAAYVILRIHEIRERPEVMKSQSLVL